jgi:autotransporter-associated beta strand protein
MDAVVIDGPGVVTVTGQNFSGTTSVKVDGIQLTSFPPQFSIPNDSTLIFIMPLVSHLGAIAVDITNATGTTGTTVDVVANSSPTVEMKSSDPGFLIQGLGLQLIVGSQVGDILVVEGSPELLSSSLPGIADFAIGNNFSSLFLLGAPAIPSAGYQELVIPMSGLPIGMKIHVQAAGLLLSDSYAFPTTMSNVQTGTVLF